MPYHPQHSHSISHDSSQAGGQHNFYSVANAVYQSGQTLASAGIPNTAGWSPGQPAQNQGQSQGQGYHLHNPPYSNGSISRSSSLRYAPPAYQQQNAGIPQSPAAQLPSRRPTISGPTMSDGFHYGAPPAYGNSNINMQIQPPTPGHPPASMPGPLQAGHSRTLSSQPPQLPPLSQISTQLQDPQQQSSLSARPPISTAHSYSKSSPGNMDPSTPKYKAFSNNTPDTSRFMSSASNAPSSSSFGPQSYSPLGLADIRQRTEANLAESLLSPGGPALEEQVPYPTNSNYVAPWPIFAVDWCKWPPKTNVGVGKIAIGSYLEDNHNYIQILDAQKTQIDPEKPQGERGIDFVKTAEANHAYPVTRILWEPPSSNKQSTDLLATSGDHLRLWSLPNEAASYTSNTITRQGSKDVPLQKLSPLALLSNSKSPEHTAPITSLDWNIIQPSLIITSSIDTTCTIWDIPTLTAKTQLIAHDKEVFDVRFCAQSVDVFVSCGADGSVRMFDLRSLEHSTIIYEPNDKQDKTLSPDAMSSSPTRGGGSSSHSLSFPPPLLRIAASPHDAHLLATFSQDSNIIRVLDVRQPGQALLELKGHGASVNCIEWSSSQRGILASGADDCCVMLWDLVSSATGSLPQPGHPAGQSGQERGQERGPSAVWDCPYEISNLSWAPTTGSLGVCGGRGLWGVSL